MNTCVQGKKRKRMEILETKIKMGLITQKWQNKNRPELQMAFTSNEIIAIVNGYTMHTNYYY